MDALKDLLPKNRPSKPPQLAALQAYVAKNYNQRVSTSVSRLGYTLTVPNAPLATTLQMEMPKLIVACNLDKKLFIRIGQF